MILIVLLANFLISNQNDQYVGSWISKEDPSWKIIFSDSECTWYYEGKVTGRFLYSVSNSSPQCQTEVPVENYTSYLQLTSKSDSEDVICYEVNGFSELSTGEKTMSLRPVDKGGYFLFIKQSFK